MNHLSESAIVATHVPHRYHDLDAFRAWAVLLGIVLHIAWIMLPFQMATPIVDVDHNDPAYWLFWFIHLFRMQAFFLVAGFFGNLVYQRKGFGHFCRHRFIRIVIPFVIGWCILIPWIYLYYAWGEVVSGASLSGESFGQRYWRILSTELTGPGFPMMHLWFLWDLLLLYVATLAVKSVVDRWLNPNGRIRVWFGQRFRHLMQSRAKILYLAIPSGLLLLPMKYWIGIEGYPSWLLPDWYGFFSYWLFFLVGWMLYAYRDLLPTLARYWRTDLLIGFLISLPVWGLYEYQIRQEIGFAYPAVTDSHIRDYGEFRTAMLNMAIQEDNLIGQEIWHRLGSEWQRRITEHSELNVNELSGLANLLNGSVIFAAALDGSDQDALPIEQIALQNRMALDAVVPGAFTAPLRYTASIVVFKTVYSALYALAMWTLVFGFLGFFQTYFRHPSARLRYISDSSYWLYLLHLPLTFWIAMYLSQLQMGSLAKFVCYNVLVVAILMPTYHYFVRSTLIGQVLNGRRYPYRPFFQSDLFAEARPVQTEFPAVETSSETDSVVASDRESVFGGH